VNGYILPLEGEKVMNHPDVRCVIFDMDGTLTRTNELIFASFNHVASKYLGKTMTPGEIVALFGPPEEGGLSELVGERRAAAAMDDLCEFYRQHHNELAHLHHGIEQVLLHLRAHGVLLAIFTGKGRRTTEITLNEFKLKPYFDIVVSGSDVEHHKPHPEGIRLVLSALRVRPDETIMVGDSLADIAASREAGVRIASVVWDSFDKDRVIRENSETLFHTVEDMHSWFSERVNSRL
jgi:HAD superfamily hydrolase (TIGR01509 family)